jgi:hypothetical protein
MKSKHLLKTLIIIGGIIEIIIGSMFLFLDVIFEQIGLENIPIFTQMAGTFLLCYGILLIYSARDVENYLIILLVNILFRIIMITFSFINIFEYPEFFVILLFAIPYDLVWSIFVIIFLKKRGIILKKS